MLRAIFLSSFLATAAHADIWTLYDGNGNYVVGQSDTQAGVTCQYYNTAALISWHNPGGDWIDRNGVHQGSTPVASASYYTSNYKPQVVTLNAINLIRAPGIVLRRNAERVAKVASRESLTPPELILTLSDGSVVTRTPIADASLPFSSPGVCQSIATGKGPTMTLGHSAVMSFGALPDNVVAARLQLTLTETYSDGVIEAYAMVLPRHDLPDASTVNTSAAPYYKEDFERDDWWARTGGTFKPQVTWTQDHGRFVAQLQSGIWFADPNGENVPAQETHTLIDRGHGYKGRGVMAVYHPSIVGYGVTLGNVVTKSLTPTRTEPDEAWLTYKIKYSSDFQYLARCEGGKAPGLSGATSVCAGASTPANGYCGWSLRMSYRLICDKNNPAFNRIVLYTYAYHGLMTGMSGKGFFGNEHAAIELDKWHCVEQRVRVNTPGVADGINQVYIDGNLAIDKRDMYLRAVKPSPEGYGDWRLVTKYAPAPIGKRIITDSFGRQFWFAGTKLTDSELAIQKAYMVVHNGGLTPPRKNARLWLDDVTMSEKRIGCGDFDGPVE